MVKDFCELVRGLISSNEDALSVLVTGTTGSVLTLFADIARRCDHISDVGNADVFADPTPDTGKRNAGLFGLGVGHGHSSVDCGGQDCLAGSHTVDGIATGHLATTITPLMAVNTRGRATGVVVATEVGLLPGMLRYIVLWISG